MSSVCFVSLSLGLTSHFLGYFDLIREYTKVTSIIQLRCRYGLPLLVLANLVSLDAILCITHSFFLYNSYYDSRLLASESSYDVPSRIGGA